jgi:hypothetical protein
MSNADLRKLRELIVLLATLALALLLHSCSQTKPDQLESGLAVQPLAAHDAVDLQLPVGDPLSELPGLPDGDPVAEPDRNLSFTNIVSYNGNGIFDASPGALFPSNSIVLPSSQGDVAWARYAINTGGYQPEHLGVDLVCNPGSVAFVGYSDYGQGRWQWEKPTGSSAGYDLPQGLYLNSTGQFFIIVLTYGGSVATVNSLSARFDNDVLYDNSISGILLDEHGAPLASQLVSVTPNPDFVNVYTDVDGSYFIGLPTAGMYDVQPEAFDFLWTPASLAVDVSGDMVDIDFSGKRIDIRGRVADAEGAGVPGMQLTLNPSARTTVSGADGEYAFLGVASGDHTLDPLNAGYSFLPASAGISVGSSDLDNIDFTATGGQPVYGITGSILLADLSPVPGVLVVMQPGYRITISDLAGNFTFTGLPPATYTLAPSLGQYTFAPSVRNVILSGASENNANFTAIPPPPTYSIGGKVRWNDEAQGGFSRELPGIKVQIESGTGNRQVLYSSISQQDGKFNIPGVPDGNYKLSVSGQGYDPGILSSLLVDKGAIYQLLFVNRTGPPSWKNFTARYVSNHCTSCHRPDSQTAASPFLRDYAEVKAAAVNCNARIQNDSMPPSLLNHVTDKRLFELWIEEGYPFE